MTSHFQGRPLSLAHHWLGRMRGGEKVLEQFSILFPEAPITTLVSSPDHLSDRLRGHRIRNSPLQFLGGKRFYKQMMPLFPLVIPMTSVGKKGGIVLSSDASVIKGFRMPEDVIHLCYCHSPPRYLWDLQKTYEEQSSGMGTLARMVFRSAVPHVREFDRKAATRVDHFIANSRFVQKRILTCYGRHSTVIHPPVDVEQFDATRSREDFYLIVSELTPYKRVDLAIEAFRGFKGRLVIIGDGPEGKRLRGSAPSNVRFLGRQPFEEVKNHLELCRAFLNPQIEDFGITSVEALAAGAPVIAYRDGGALEIVEEERTGLFFDRQNSPTLKGCLMRFERTFHSDPLACRATVLKFCPERFRHQIMEFMSAVLSDVTPSPNNTGLN